ncbi:hypothetical protein HJG60_010095 [Phyllostomus discolor]|uniref:Uncharacterized protein n=1 Tax=Phyllostomus discolor TaxID=89673 RepID=A0A834AYP3_9CHIR|nr:hypothetical protein HJG60_010095 [Phyllostomus discolor]
MPSPTTPPEAQLRNSSQISRAGPLTHSKGENWRATGAGSGRRGWRAPQRPRPLLGSRPSSPLLPPVTKPGALHLGPRPGRPLPPRPPPSGASVHVWKVLSRNKGAGAEARPARPVSNGQLL